MSTNHTEENRANQRVINRAHPEGIPSRAVQLIDLRARGKDISDEDSEYLATLMQVDFRVHEWYEFEMDLAKELVVA